MYSVYVLYNGDTENTMYQGSDRSVHMLLYTNAKGTDGFQLRIFSLKSYQSLIICQKTRTFYESRDATLTVIISE